MRGLRGNGTSRIKKAMFEVFGEYDLPSISVSSTPTEIHTWKSSSEVRLAFRKLHNKMPNKNYTYLERIVEKCWGKMRSITNVTIAWTVAVVDGFLNPRVEGIQMSSRLKSQIRKNLVCISISNLYSKTLYNVLN
jgi:hypothetical protein